MSRFHFRLEASRTLAEQTFEKVQREFAQELRLWRSMVEAYENQKKILREALEGQRKISRERPQELGIWQIYISEQQRRLRRCNADLKKQELVIVKVRQNLLEAHRELEKLERLKEKQTRAYQLAELQKEQRNLDETGQVLHWRKQLSHIT
jgi:flagellar FliJ protein